MARSLLDRAVRRRRVPGGVVSGRARWRWCCSASSAGSATGSRPRHRCLRRLLHGGERLPGARAHAEARRAHPRDADPRARRRGGRDAGSSCGRSPSRRCSPALFAFYSVRLALPVVAVPRHLDRQRRDAAVDSAARDGGRHRRPAHRLRRRAGASSGGHAARPSPRRHCIMSDRRRRCRAHRERAHGRADHDAADRRAVRAARQRRVDRPRARRRRVDRHGALLVAAGGRRDGGDDLGHRVVVDADRAAAVRLDGRDPVPHATVGGHVQGLAPWLERVPGRLLHTNIIGCTIFAAVSGSSAATCATIGKMTLPELARRGYPEGITVGTLAGAGTLGLLIPPSIIMIVYGVSGQRLDRAAVHRRRRSRASCSRCCSPGTSSSGRWCIPSASPPRPTRTTLRAEAARVAAPDPGRAADRAWCWARSTPASRPRPRRRRSASSARSLISAAAGLARLADVSREPAWARRASTA